MVAPSPAAAGIDESVAAAPPRPTSQDRHPFPALAEGWAVIGRCRFGTGGPGPHATGCYALAHPEVGVALIDIAPHATPNAEARLRRALTAAEFWPDFPGTLPVLHDRVEITALRGLPWLLDRSFAALPALTVPGGDAWIEGIRRAMATDPAWELPGQPKAAPEPSPAPIDDAEEPAALASPTRARPRRWGRVVALPLAFVATFAVGLFSGFLLLDSPSPATAPTVVAAPPSRAKAEPVPATAPTVIAALPSATTAPPASPVGATEGTPSAPEAPTTRATAPAAMAPTATTTAGAEAPPASTVPIEASPAAAALSAPGEALSTAEGSAPAEAPGSAPAVQHAQRAVGEPAEAGGPASSSPLETRVALAAPVEEQRLPVAPLRAPPVEERSLPLAPPRAPPPPRASAPAGPVRVSATQPPRAVPVIDRACSQALFRFQQGERLSAAEQGFIRTGCSTARR